VVAVASHHPALTTFDDFRPPLTLPHLQCFCNHIFLSSHFLKINTGCVVVAVVLLLLLTYCLRLFARALQPTPSLAVSPCSRCRYEPPIPTRIGKRKKKSGPDAVHKLPTVTPHANCKLRLLKLERIKDYLLLEQEFIQNQERLKPQEERNKEERDKVDELRGAPMQVGTLEEIIDDNHAIVSSPTGPEYVCSRMACILSPPCLVEMSCASSPHRALLK
jgi:hypothetical protein